MVCAAITSPAQADTLRIATYHTELERNGPGVFLRDLLRGEDAHITSVQAVIAEAAPDILLLQGMDYDLYGHALRVFADGLDERGQNYPYQLALLPNAGMATGLDIDGNGRLNEARDAQGFGLFSGNGGMAILSRYPILEDRVLDHSAFLWRDLPGGEADLVLTPEVAAIQRLASVAAWEVPIGTGGGSLTLLVMHASPPVFDGPEDRNGRRNQDELRFFLERINGWGPQGASALRGPFALMGNFNADPVDGEARRDVLAAVLTHPALQDPAPESAQAAALGDATDTVDWDDPVPGNLRVSYVLPSSELVVMDAGVTWPEDSSGEAGSRHGLVWVDLMVEGTGDS